MLDKIYVIDDLPFKVKTDLTLNERYEISELLKNVTTENGGIKAEMSKEQATRLLELISEPEVDLKGHKVDFGNIKESTETEMIAFFLMSRAKAGQDIQSSLMSSLAN